MLNHLLWINNMFHWCVGRNKQEINNLLILYNDGNKVLIILECNNLGFNVCKFGAICLVLKHNIGLL
jgi:hypothetical protein